MLLTRSAARVCAQASSCSKPVTSRLVLVFFETCSASKGKVAQHAAAAGQVLLKARQNVVNLAVLSSADHLQACKGSLVEVLASNAQSRFRV